MLFLIGLIFESKISLAFIPGIPFQWGAYIYQYGLHPFMNVLLNLIVGGFLIFRSTENSLYQYQFYKSYRFYIFLFLVSLLGLTFCQILLTDTANPPLMSLGAAVLVGFTVILYGQIIPRHLPANTFIKSTLNFSLIFCWLSLVLFFISPDTSFKGGRFIGIFKHIPYMVTCATLACQMLIYYFFVAERNTHQKIFDYLSFATAFFILILTGTRSALFAVIMSYFLAGILFPAKKATTQFVKTTISMAVVLAALLFGHQMIGYVTNVLTGQAAIGYRAAQDGVASRLDEFERGYEIFKKNQFLGTGLLSKFGEISEAEVGQYNANKDPHNLLISAGVLGGWLLLVLVAVGFLGLILATFSKLRGRDANLKVLAIYVATQIPILFIYHMHLSVGGMADRIYWIMFGYMMVLINTNRREST